MRVKGLLSGLLMLSAMTVSAATPITQEQNDTLEALHLDWLDTNISPTKDFFGYANGNWQKNNPVPAHYSSWGTFYILDETVRKKVHGLLIKAAHDKSAKPGSIEQKIGDFYFSGMDESSINKLGVTPLAPEFASIEAIKTIKDLQDVITSLQQIGVNVCFDFASMQDFANSEVMIGAAFQAGLGLPDRDYYLKEDEKFKKIRVIYAEHIKQMFELLGDSASKALAESKVVMSIETALATASMTKIKQRDPHAVYNMVDVATLEDSMPNFSWSRYLKAQGVPTVKRINLGMPLFFKTMNQMLKTVSLNDWKVYLRWHVISGFSPYLSKPFVDQNFKMSSALSGAKKLLPRWQRVVNTENGALGFAIGKIYVQQYFPAESKQEVLKIVHNIREALRNDLKTLSWMTPATRQAALKKLDLMGERVGYPDKWWDYSTLNIDRGPYVLNVKRANEFLTHRDLNKIGKPIDKTEWAMSPQTVNAYYDPSMNNINLPAGILQAPFFDPKAPAAINYGAIGYVIGHEMTHGFDDQGAQFDGHGNLKNWWTPEDLKKFKEATHCIMTQFSKFEIEKGLHLQGELVMGEATADLGGLILAYRAFHASAAYKSAKTIGGFTPDQQFFIGLAHVEAANIRPEQLRQLVTVDPHPPMMFRVNGTIANMPEFKSAFSVPDVSPMMNSSRCVIW